MFTTTSVLLFTSVVIALTLLGSVAIYRHERKGGNTHESSFTSSVLFNALLIGTTLFNFILYVTEFE